MTFSKKFVLIPLLILALLGPSLAPFAESFNFPDKYDLVAILVEQGLYADPDDYDGLPDEPDTNIKARVDRYAIDLQKALPGTRAVVIQADRFEAPENIMAVLERLYFDGDPREPSRVAYLKGVVIVGEVPLPVVNKKGNRFISLFPYTDFEDKFYVWNPETREFEPKGENPSPRPEIWHGVIRPPMSTQTPEGKNLLASYLDKNHLYREGDENYAEFTKRVFFQDFVAEKKNLNPIAYKNHLNFLKHWGDIAYYRYTKKLFGELSGPIQQELEKDQAEVKALQEALGEGSGPLSRTPFDDDVPPPEFTEEEQADIDIGREAAGDSGTAEPDPQSTPDILTKVSKMSDNLMYRFDQLFTKYPAMVNDLMKGTGRYSEITGDDLRVFVDTAVNLIKAKDQYSLSYLKGVNEMVENKIDEVVGELQKPVLFETVKITAAWAKKNPGSEDEEIKEFDDDDVDDEKQIIEYVNFSPAAEYDGSGLADDDADLPDRLNGVELKRVQSVEYCTPYRGTMGSEEVGNYAKLVEFNRALDELTARDQKDLDDDEDDFELVPSGRTQAEVNSRRGCYPWGESGDDVTDRDNSCEGLKHFAGCFYEGFKFYENPPPTQQDLSFLPGFLIEPGSLKSCFPEFATNQVFIASGTREITEEPREGYDDFRSCQTFRSKQFFSSIEDDVADDDIEVDDQRSYLRAAWDQLEERQEEAECEGGDVQTCRRLVEIIRIINSNIPPKDRNPSGMALLYDNDFGMVTLQHVLDARGKTLREFLSGETAENSSRTLIVDLGPAASGVGGMALNGVDQVQLTIERIPLRIMTGSPPMAVPKKIPSVMYHKEPTNETLNVQAQSLITRELPVDFPRYVTFQDQEDDVQKIVYPDLYTEESFDAYLARLEEIENFLNAVPRESGTELPCNRCLRDLISPLPEEANFPDGRDIELIRANRTKVHDALLWRNMDVDSKHHYLLENYLDREKLAYVGEQEKGYELAYINGSGTANFYNFSVTPEEPDPEGVGLDNGAIPEIEGPPDDDPRNPFDDPEPDEGGYDLFSWSPPPISPWWDRMEEWADELSATVAEFRVGIGELEFYAGLDEENEQELERIREESRAFEASLNGGEEVPLTRISEIRLETDSTVTAVRKRADIMLTLHDAEGAAVRDEFAKVTLTLEGSGTFGGGARDEEPGRPGLQTTVMSGSARIGIVAPDLPGTMKLTAQLDEVPEVKTELTLQAVADAKIVLEVSALGVIADGAQEVVIEVSARDGENRLIPQANGKVRLGLSDPLLGRLAEEEIQLTAGEGEARFIAGSRKGKVVINAASGSLDPGTAEISLLPGAPARIGLSASSDVLAILPGEQVEIEALLFDAFGNIVDTNSAAQISFRLTEHSAAFGSLSSLSERVSDGVAHVTLAPRTETGTITVIAESPDLRPAAVKVKAVKQFGGPGISAIQPDALTIALLGIPGGDVAEKDYLGGWLTMNGRTQATTSLTAQPHPVKKLFQVHADGGIDIPNPDRISTRFLPANNFSMVIGDTRTQADLAVYTIFVSREGQFAVTEEADPEKLTDGIYMRKTAPEEAYSADLKRGSLRLAKDDAERIEVQTNGFVRVFDNDFSVRVKSAKFLMLEVLDKEKPVAEIFFVQRFSQDVRVQAEISQAPGVYVAPARTSPNITHARAYTSNSTSHPRGIAFYDKNEPVRSGEPGFGFKSLDDSLETFGVGFSEDNKFALLFSAGEMFGEANRWYASDAGIVLGDPTVRINNDPPTGNFSKDVGKLLYSGAEEVKGVMDFDLDSDGKNDLLVAEGEGKIRLLHNDGGYEQLKDAGYLVNIKSGIIDFTKLDINNDGQMDLVVANKESCRKNESCLDAYENHEGALVRRHIEHDPPASPDEKREKIVTLRAEDLNRDSFPELIFADTAGDIRVLYNRNGEFETQSQLVTNLGLQVNPSANLISSVLLNYKNMDTPTDNPADQQKFFTLSVLKFNPVTRQYEEAKYEERAFLYADLDVSAFSDSEKHAQDLNGGVVRSGDRIRYTITLRNSSNAPRIEMKVSDVIADRLELDPASISCTDCVPEEMQIELLTGDPTRTHLFKDFRVPARGSRTITYEATYVGSAENADKIKLVTSNRFRDSDPALQSELSSDDYPDISASKSGTPTRQTLYIYSNGLDRSGRVVWATAPSSPPPPPSAEDYAERTGLDLGNFDELSRIPRVCTIGDFKIPFPPDDPNISTDDDNILCAGGRMRPAGPPAAAQREFDDLTMQDSDGDRLQDSIDDVSAGLDDIAGATEDTISSLTCAAGCIPMPLNIAFLAPGPYSAMGVPAGFDSGTPVFGWGAPVMPYIYPPQPSMTTTGGRIYVSPALTGGVGFSACIGPYGTPICYSFGINPLDLIAPGACDSIAGGISGALSVANSAISEANEGLTLALLGGGGGTANEGTRRGSGSGLFNPPDLGSYEAPIAASRNIRVPGFPSQVTDWWDRQLEEIMNKVTDLPDIYLIYPDAKTLIANPFDETALEPFKRIVDDPSPPDIMNAILAAVNSLALIDIQTQEVIIKVPMIGRKQIEQFKADWRQWIEDERLELDKWRNLMGCTGIAQGVDAAFDTELASEGNFGNLELCRFVTANINGLIDSLVANMRALDEWILFPKKILQFRAIQAYYVNQIIGYLDTIIQWSGGWIKKNIGIMKRWRKAVRDIANAVENIQALFSLMTDYQESCDACKTERYSLMELIMKLFAAIPSPPVIPLPKLPDIIVDVSQVQAGLRVYWPDIKFKLEPMTLPRIPRISLGANLDIPSLKLILPKVPVIPAPPALPELPALPPLNLPKLPNLPPAPKMPGLPEELEVVIDILKKILKIYCMIKLGFVPTQELQLKPKIEQITARGLSPVLPIDLLITTVTPTISFDFVEQVIVTGVTNLQFESTHIKDAVENAAKTINSYTQDFTKAWNTGVDAFSKQAEKYTSPQINLPKTELDLNYNADEYEKLFKDAMGALQKKADEREKLFATMPKELFVKVSAEPYNPAMAVGEAEILSPFQERLKEYRDHLAQYLDDSEKLFANPDIAADIGELSRFLAAQKSPFALGSPKTYIASILGEPFAARPPRARLAALELAPLPLSRSARGPQDPRLARQEADLEDADADRLLALAAPPDLSQVLAGSGAGMNPNALPRPNNVGIFTVNEDGTSERIVSYVKEASKPVQLANIDVDGDGDKDKVYTSGHDVFLKKNSREYAGENRPIFRPVDIEFWTIYELLPKGMSPYFPDSLSETSREASFTFANAPMNEIAGFEVTAKNSPLYFETPAAGRDHQTLRAHLIPNPGAEPPQVQPEMKLIEPDGTLTVEGQGPTSATVKAGEYIETGEDSSVTLQGADGTVMRVAENTGFKIPGGGYFELVKGYVEIETKETGSVFFPSGTTLAVAEGDIRFRLFDGSEIAVSSGAPFILPDFRPVLASVRRISGDAVFTGRKRDYIQQADGKIKVFSGDLLHPLQVVQLTFGAEGPGARALTLSKDVMIAVPDSAGGGMEIEIEEGVLEIIRPETGEQPAATGMAILFGESLQVQDGDLRVQYARGGDHRFRTNETYRLEALRSFDNPTLTLALDPAFYFSQIRSFNASGDFSSSSERLLLAPQVCGDDAPPLANVGKAKFKVSVGKTLPIDASRSYDSTGRVSEYYLDTDITADSDGDGTLNNDRDLLPASGTAVFTVGPYTEVGELFMRLTVVDASGNEGYQDISVEVITPTIVLEGPPLQSNIISGSIDPPEPNVPITIARLRTGGSGWEIFRTPSADPGGQYYTSADGKFRITDADLRDRLVVRDASGTVVAEINQETGRIVPTSDAYETQLLPSQPPDIPTRVALVPKDDPGNPLTAVYFVPDVNTDVSLDPPETAYNSSALSSMAGVHVKPLPDEVRAASLNFRILPGDDPVFPGAALMEKISEGATERVFLMDVNGDMHYRDPKVSVRVKDLALPVSEALRSEEPVVFELLYEGRRVAEIFIAPNADPGEAAQVVPVPVAATRPEPAPKPPKLKPKTMPFTDVAANDPFAKTLEKLYIRNIISGYPSERPDELLFKPENLINRAEFTQITENLLCIVPREEAHKLPTPFWDVLDPNLWFYAILKEGNIRGFIRGYLGEARIGEDGITRAPFKPANNITRAEAATIVLAALVEEDIIDISSVDLSIPPGGQWYDPYVRIAQDLTPYLKKEEDKAKRPFLITAGEARGAATQISRKDFAIMAERVLLMVDCNNPDTDEDGLPDRWEFTVGEPHDKGLVDIQPTGDPDGDTCDNARELELGTDPFTADTDGSGMSDCEEAARGTDPLAPGDETLLPPLGPGGASGGGTWEGGAGPGSIGDLGPIGGYEDFAQANAEGVYVVEPDCGSVCPCRATIEPGAALEPFDTIFAAITGAGGVPIYAKSNEETY